jgi:hypothetical protein
VIDEGMRLRVRVLLVLGCLMDSRTSRRRWGRAAAKADRPVNAGICEVAEMQAVSAP